MPRIHAGEKSRFQWTKPFPFRLVNAKRHCAPTSMQVSNRKKNNNKRVGATELFYGDSRRTLFNCLPIGARCICSIESFAMSMLVSTSCFGIRFSTESGCVLAAGNIGDLNDRARWRFRVIFTSDQFVPNVTALLFSVWWNEKYWRGIFYIERFCATSVRQVYFCCEVYVL